MSLNRDAQQINLSLRRRITAGELFALALAFSAAGLFLLFSPNISYAFFDFKIYLNTAHGIFDGYYYAYWYLPIFALLARLPLAVSYVLWCSINILGIFFAIRVFGGKAIVALLSYQMFYTLIYGGISGVIVGSLALCWWGLNNRKWYWAGLGVALASGKFQIGITGSLILLLMADISWKDRFRVLVVPALVLISSLFLYPSWPLQLFQNILSDPPNTFGSISLWRWMGPWALLFCIPPLVLPLPPQRRFIAWVATIGLVLPYFQQSDLLFLLVMPIGWVGLLGNLGYLMIVYGWTALQLLAILPLTVYGTNLLPAFKTLSTAQRDKPESS
jgi:hypothetical protein